MGELNGGLIQMNSHMVQSPAAARIVLIGLLLFCVFLVLAVVAFRDQEYRLMAAFAGFMLIGVAVIIIGTKQPRIQELHVCASGQVSIEQIAAKYDIMKIDGKELILRVR